MNMATPTEIVSAAMALTTHQRCEVVQQLLLSLESPETDNDVDQAWAIEIERRGIAIREVRTTLRDWDEVLASIRGSVSSRNSA